MRCRLIVAGNDKEVVNKSEKGTENKIRSYSNAAYV